MSRVIKNNDGVAVVEGTPAASLVKDVDKFFASKPPEKMAGESIAQPKKIYKENASLRAITYAPSVGRMTPEDLEMRKKLREENDGRTVSEIMQEKREKEGGFPIKEGLTERKPPSNPRTRPTSPLRPKEGSTERKPPSNPRTRPTSPLRPSGDIGIGGGPGIPPRFPKGETRESTPVDGTKVSVDQLSRMKEAKDKAESRRKRSFERRRSRREARRSQSEREATRGRFISTLRR